MKARKCEFDDGRPHDADAEFAVSRRDEYGHFRREMAFCKRHFVVYAQVVSEEEGVPI